MEVSFGTCNCCTGGYQTVIGHRDLLLNNFFIAGGISEVILCDPIWLEEVIHLGHLNNRESSSELISSKVTRVVWLDEQMINLQLCKQRNCPQGTLSLLKKEDIIGKYKSQTNILKMDKWIDPQTFFSIITTSPFFRSNSSSVWPL